MWLFRSGLMVFGYTALVIYTGIKVHGLVKYLLPGLRFFVFWPLFIIVGYAYIIIYFLRLDRMEPLRRIAMFSLPFMVYLFFILLAFDLARLVIRLLRRPLSPGFLAAATGIALGLAVLVMVYGALNARYIRPVNYKVTLRAGGRESPLRIALISDLHIGETVNRKWVARIVDAVNKTGPDLICIAGDVFDNNVTGLPELDAIRGELGRLAAPLGVYAVPGNHDFDRQSGSLDAIGDFLSAAGIVFLQDEAVLVENRFYLAGRRDARRTRKSAAEFLTGLDTSMPLVVMDHQPVDYPPLEAAGADLIFSGHTHRGQFFPGSVATSRIFRKAGATDYGHWRGVSAQGIISSGCGVWGPPIRVLTGSEVAVVDISFEG